MQFYKEGLAPEELQPDWDYWNRVPESSLKNLCFLAFGIEPNNFESYFSYIDDLRGDLRKIYDKNFQEGLGKELIKPDVEGEPYEVVIVESIEEKKLKSDIKTALKIKDNIVSKINKFHQIALMNIRNDILSIDSDAVSTEDYDRVLSDRYTKLSDNLGIPTIDLDIKLFMIDFIDWLDSQDTPYPEQFKNCIRMRDKPDITIISSLEKNKTSHVLIEDTPVIKNEVKPRERKKVIQMIDVFEKLNGTSRDNAMLQDMLKYLKVLIEEYYGCKPTYTELQKDLQLHGLTTITTATIKKYYRNN